MKIKLNPREIAAVTNGFQSGDMWLWDWLQRCDAEIEKSESAKSVRRLIWEEEDVS